MRDIRVLSDSELIYNVSNKVDTMEVGQSLSAFLETLTPSRRKIAESAIELYKRETAREKNLTTIKDSMDGYEYMYPLIADLPIEEFWVIYMNQGSKVIGRERLSVGGISGTLVDVRCLLRGALMNRATCICIAHNHPSEQARPSREDDDLTRRIYSAAKAMDIRLLDHIIVAGRRYYSYADEGKIG
jgi:DNA repair protein RadC